MSATPKSTLDYYKWSLIFALVGIILGGVIGAYSGNPAGGALQGAITGLTSVVTLAVLETVFSFDNAAVNAKILENWDEKWRQIFLTGGMIVAVGFMRAVFPILIVSVTTGIGFFDTITLALEDPLKYAAALHAHGHQIEGFGGAFLFMLVMDFWLTDHDIKLIPLIENHLPKLAKVEGIAAAIVLTTLFAISRLITDPVHANEFFIAGIIGVVTFIVAHGLGAFGGGDDGVEDDNEIEIDAATGFAPKTLAKNVIKQGLVGFLYIELLDASFSFDGVIGAFAITNDLPLIILGLAIGALFVRSMTIHLVDAKVMSEYPLLEHGAMLAISALVVMMLGKPLGLDVPEFVAAAAPALIIGYAFWRSLKLNRQEASANQAPFASVPA